MRTDGSPPSGGVRRREAAAYLGLALIGVHIADDNFVQPQPGTAAVDHLVSGLVPLAALALVAISYRRVGHGARAILTIAVGAFGVVIGAGEAVYYSIAVGPSGDDYTGLLAVAGGALLVGVGVTTLWQTRRRHSSIWRRYLRRAIIVVISVGAAYFVFLPFGLSYVFTHSARAVVPEAKLDAAYENVKFSTRDGLTLKGWYVPSRNGAAVIAAPGRAGSQRPARMLVHHGYGVLLFDRRGEGKSDGDPNEFGWSGATDLDAAVTYLEHRRDVRGGRIGGIGLSVGAETLLQAAAQSHGLKAVVSDGAGSRSVREDASLAGWRNWAEVPTSMVVSAGVALFSNRLPPPQLNALVARIAPRPVLFIYGEHDQPNVRGLTPKYYRNAGDPKELWRVPGAGHTGGIDARPREYERRVTRFFDRALLGAR